MEFGVSITSKPTSCSDDWIGGGEWRRGRPREAANAAGILISANPPTYHECSVRALRLRNVIGPA